MAADSDSYTPAALEAYLQTPESRTRLVSTQTQAQEVENLRLELARPDFNPLQTAWVLYRLGVGYTQIAQLLPQLQDQPAWGQRLESLVLCQEPEVPGPEVLTAKTAQEMTPRQVALTEAARGYPVTGNYRALMESHYLNSVEAKGVWSQNRYQEIVLRKNREDLYPRSSSNHLQGVLGAAKTGNLEMLRRILARPRAYGLGPYLVDGESENPRPKLWSYLLVNAVEGGLETFRTVMEMSPPQSPRLYRTCFLKASLIRKYEVAQLIARESPQDYSREMYRARFHHLSREAQLKELEGVVDLELLGDLALDAAHGGQDYILMEIVNRGPVDSGKIAKVLAFQGYLGLLEILVLCVPPSAEAWEEIGEAGAENGRLTVVTLGMVHTVSPHFCARVVMAAVREGARKLLVYLLGILQIPGKTLHLMWKESVEVDREMADLLKSSKKPAKPGK